MLVILDMYLFMPHTYIDFHLKLVVAKNDE